MPATLLRIYKLRKSAPFKDLPAPYNRGSRCDFLRHFFICFCSARIVHFFIGTYLRTIYCVVSQNLGHAYARFIHFVKNGYAATGQVFKVAHMYHEPLVIRLLFFRSRKN